MRFSLFWKTSANIDILKKGCINKQFSEDGVNYDR